MGTPFLMWYDDSPKHTLAQKIAAACEAYQQWFGVAPTLVLVSPDDGPVPPGGLVTTRQASNIRRNTVWAGQD